MILAAKLTEKLTLVEVTISASTIGEAIEIVNPYKEIYGSVLTQKGTGSFNSSLPGNTYTDNISFYCRYIELPESKKKYRLLYKDQLYRIINISPVQRSKATVIDCTAIK